MSDAEKQLYTEEVMRIIGNSIDEILKKYIDHMGFALLVFELGKPGISNYISNAQRKDMIEALKETVKRLEAKEDVPAVHTTVQ